MIETQIKVDTSTITEVRNFNFSDLLQSLEWLLIIAK
jgi:hypothetical protein